MQNKTNQMKYLADCEISKCKRVQLKSYVKFPSLSLSAITHANLMDHVQKLLEKLIFVLESHETHGRKHIVVYYKETSSNNM